MAKSPLFAVAATKLARARDELCRLDDYLAAYDRSDLRNEWSRTAAIALAVHSAYTGIEDVMTVIARVVDAFVPHGATSHQALLDQMRVPLDGRRPALLDDALYRDLTELKAFRHLVRHQYGIDLVPDKTEAKRTLAVKAVEGFGAALARLEHILDAG